MALLNISNIDIPEIYRDKKLVGPIPSAHFLTYVGTDGCTKSPDFWWVVACVIHDYEYWHLRKVHEEIVETQGRIDKGGLPPEVQEQQIIVREMMKTKAKFMRRFADSHLKENMRRLSDGHWAKAAFAWWISRHYNRAVRLFGASAAKSKKGKPNA